MNVAITGAGTGASNNLVRSLRAGRDNVRIVGCHHDRFVIQKSEADCNHVVPQSSDSRFSGALCKLIESQRVDLLVPGNDHDVRALAAIRERMPCRLFLPRASAIDLCQDKYALTAHLQARGLPVAKTYPVTCREDVHMAFGALAGARMLWCRTRTGFGSRGATKVRDADQAWAWIEYWHVMRDVAIDEFTLSEFLPGRDYNAQGLWKDGTLELIKMCERLSYLEGGNRPSGMSSTPALAKTVCEESVLRFATEAVRAVDDDASGVFNVDFKENRDGVPCVTEINAGRFAMITNLYDFTGRHNMAGAYVSLAMGEPLDVDEKIDVEEDFYLIRELDTLPDIVHVDAMLG